VKLKRRDALKLGSVTVVGGAALAEAGKPRDKNGQAVTATMSPLSSANFPQRYAVNMTKIPAAVPTAATNQS
jgi:hypothetical protein